ncbi:hypothetical protein B0H10DRAFT_2062625 [Mycena sp. CBHHK59/15]|nr:hypothetical protein B0H10DRAFT_2062625 [Mycena sp. CBHHK59/15]
MSLVKILTALVNLICGNSESTPGAGQPPQQHVNQQSNQQHQYSPQKPPTEPHHGQQQRPQPVQHFSDPNQVNQHNERYVRLRAQANEEGDQMAKSFAESHEAYGRGDGAGAKQLSNQGKEHQRKMVELNKEASNWIFIENNKDSKPGEIDLHGLYIKEAIEQTDKALEEAKRRGDSEVHLIVGKGLHSQGGAAKIKPAIEELMQKHRLFAELDPHNAGVLVVRMGEREGGVGPEEITRRLERDDQGCTIM